MGCDFVCLKGDLIWSLALPSRLQHRHLQTPISSRDNVPSGHFAIPSDTMSSSDKFHDYYADLNPQLPRNMVFDMDMDGPEAYNGTNYVDGSPVQHNEVKVNEPNRRLAEWSDNEDEDEVAQIFASGSEYVLLPTLKHSGELTFTLQLHRPVPKPVRRQFVNSFKPTPTHTRSSQRPLRLLSTPATDRCCSRSWLCFRRTVVATGCGGEPPLCTNIAGNHLHVVP
jgi:hypothetical protein